MAYEEFLSMINSKQEEINLLKEQNKQISSSAHIIEENLTLAVFIDQVKISDFGSV